MKVIDKNMDLNRNHPTDTFEFDAFLSYSHADAKAVRKLQVYLQQ